MEDPNLYNEYYSKFVGKYCKRFYTPFKEENIFKILEFKLDGEAYFRVSENVWLDVDDCTIITNELTLEDEFRTVNIHDEMYEGFNPFNRRK